MARRILLLITDLEIGGTPTVVRELSTHLAAAGSAQIEVACLSRSGPVAEQIQQRGIAVTALNARGPSDVSAIGRLLRLLRQRRIDTVFSFLLHANAAAAAVSAMLPGRRFIQSIQTTQPYPRWHWAVQRWAQHASDLIVVPSPSVGLVAQARSGVPPAKIRVIPNAVDAGVFSPSLVPRESPAPYPVGFIGRFDPVKRVPDLVRAAARLRGRVHLHLFGDGPDRGRIEAVVTELNAGDMVTLHGRVARPQEALGRLGMFVLPSLSEGMPLVLIEAMAAGVPVVARNAPGVRDVVQNEQTGLLTPTHSIEDLAGAMQRLIDDRALRLRLIAAAEEEVRRRYAWPVVLDEYRRVLGV